MGKQRRLNSEWGRMWKTSSWSNKGTISAFCWMCCNAVCGGKRTWWATPEQVLWHRNAPDLWSRSAKFESLFLVVSYGAPENVGVVHKVGILPLYICPSRKCWGGILSWDITTLHLSLQKMLPLHTSFWECKLKLITATPLHSLSLPHSLIIFLLFDVTIRS